MIKRGLSIAILVATRDAATALLARARAFVGEYRLDVPAAATVTVDDEPVTITQPLLLAIGAHVLVARAAGFDELRRTVHVVGGEDQALALTLVATAPPPVVPPPPTAATVVQPPIVTPTPAPMMTPIGVGAIAPTPPPPGAVVQIPASNGLPPGGLVTIESGGAIARCTLPCSLGVAPGLATVSLALMNRMLVRQVSMPTGPSTLHISLDNSSDAILGVTLGIGLGGGFGALGVWALTQPAFGSHGDRSLNYVVGAVGIVGGAVLFVLGVVTLIELHGDSVTVEPGYGGGRGGFGRHVRLRHAPTLSFGADIPYGGGAVLGGTLRF
jgi:hypothetical protein